MSNPRGWRRPRPGPARALHLRLHPTGRRAASRLSSARRVAQAPLERHLVREELADACVENHAPRPSRGGLTWTAVQRVGRSSWLPDASPSPRESPLAAAPSSSSPAVDAKNVAEVVELGRPPPRPYDAGRHPRTKAHPQPPPPPPPASSCRNVCNARNASSSSSFPAVSSSSLGEHRRERRYPVRRRLTAARRRAATPERPCPRAPAGRRASEPACDGHEPAPFPHVFASSSVAALFDPPRRSCNATRRCDALGSGWERRHRVRRPGRGERGRRRSPGRRRPPPRSPHRVGPSSPAGPSSSRGWRVRGRHPRGCREGIDRVTARAAHARLRGANLRPEERALVEPSRRGFRLNVRCPHVRREGARGGAVGVALPRPPPACARSPFLSPPLPPLPSPSSPTTPRMAPTAGCGRRRPAGEGEQRASGGHRRSDSSRVACLSPPSVTCRARRFTATTATAAGLTIVRTAHSRGRAGAVRQEQRARSHRRRHRAARPSSHVATRRSTTRDRRTAARRCAWTRADRGGSTTDLDGKVFLIGAGRVFHHVDRPRPPPAPRVRTVSSGDDLGASDAALLDEAHGRPRPARRASVLVDARSWTQPDIDTLLVSLCWATRSLRPRTADARPCSPSRVDGRVARNGFSYGSCRQSPPRSPIPEDAGCKRF